MTKKQVIMGILILGIIIGLVVVFINKQEKQENKLMEKIETVDISEVFEIEDIENNNYKKEQTEKNQIASKYTIGTTTYELKANVKLMDITGKMIYVRESYNKLNIYQTEYKLDKYENINSQVEEIMREFEQECKQYLIIEDIENMENEKLYGEASQKEEIPLGESIYYDNRLYSKTYKKEEKTYDINFYRNNEKIICELVYVM